MHLGPVEDHVGGEATPLDAQVLVGAGDQPAKGRLCLAHWMGRLLAPSPDDAVWAVAEPRKISRMRVTASTPRRHEHAQWKYAAWRQAWSTGLPLQSRVTTSPAPRPHLHVMERSLVGTVCPASGGGRAHEGDWKHPSCSAQVRIVSRVETMAS